MQLVLTGQQTDGKSVIVADREPAVLVAAAVPNFQNALLAAADARPALPTDGPGVAHEGFFPPVGGYRFFVFTIDPEGSFEPHVPTPDEMADAEVMFPGLFSIYDEQGFERTDTVDFGYIAAGEATLELDDGVTRVLRAGDAFVQHGTRHRWRNLGSEQAKLVVVILGTDRTKST